MNYSGTMLRTRAEVESIQPDWVALHARSPDKSPPLHPDWCIAWLDTLGETYVAPDALRVAIVRKAGRLVAVLPLYLERAAGLRRIRTLRMISTGESENEETCPDYVGPLLEAEFRTEALLNLTGILTEDRDWDQLDLYDISAGSAEFCASIESRFGAEKTTREPRGFCPRADISSGVLPLLDQLNSKTRRNDRRLLRQVEENHLRLRTPATQSEMLTMFDGMIELHRARWQTSGKPGAFDSLAFVNMHRILIERWYTSGRVYLAELREPGGQPLAILYGFIEGKEFHFYQCGVDHSAKNLVHSPGTALILLAMEDLAKREIDCFDFLRGSQPYKLEHATDRREMIRLQVRRSLKASLPGKSELFQFLRNARQSLRQAR